MCSSPAPSGTNGRRRLSYYCALIHRVKALVWGHTDQVSEDFNNMVSYLALPLLGIYPEKNMVQKDSGIPEFTVAPFTEAKTWKQPKHPSTDEWIKM